MLEARNKGDAKTEEFTKPNPHRYEESDKENRTKTEPTDGPEPSDGHTGKREPKPTQCNCTIIDSGGDRIIRVAFSGGETQREREMIHWASFWSPVPVNPNNSIMKKLLIPIKENVAGN